MRYLLAALGILLAARSGAVIQTETIEYRAGETAHRGVLTYDDARSGRLPLVLIVHEWWGLGDHVRTSARKLAELGYVGFAVDMYGEGRLTKDPQEAARWATEVRSNPATAEARFRAALDVARKHARVDPARVAAIGYCFGGTICLEIARLAVDVAGVVSFHGGLASQVPAEKRKTRARVLVLHGADDPTVPQAQVEAFQEEMRGARVDWQFVAYGGAVHSFTNKDASSPSARYNPAADRRSWQAMRAFLEELFGALNP